MVLVGSQVKSRMNRDSKNDNFNCDNILKYHYRIVEGSKRISIYKKEVWKELIDDISSKGIAYGYVIDSSIKFLMYLHDYEYKSYSLNDIVKIFRKEFPNMEDWYSTYVLSIVLKFSDRGPEFADEVMNDVGLNYSNHDCFKKYISKIRNINILNDHNIDYNDAVFLIDNKMFLIKLFNAYFHKNIWFMIDSSLNVRGIDDYNNLYIGKLIDHNIVLYPISMDDDLDYYIISITNKDLIISRKDKDIYCEDSVIEISKIKRNVDNYVAFYNNFKNIYKNTLVDEKHIKLHIELGIKALEDIDYINNTSKAESMLDLQRLYKKTKH